MEKLIDKFKLPLIERHSTIEVILILGYRKTGNKFSVVFNGSAGYLSNIVIICEGIQKEDNNIIWIENLRNKDMSLKSKMVSIFHSEENGIRVEISGRR
jgi:hypothetical protein